MGLLANIADRFAAICGLPVRAPGPSPLEAARAARKSAAEAYADAVIRKDARDKNRTLRAYRKATREVLHLEALEGPR